MIVFQFILYFLSFIAIWYGAGLIVNSVNRFSKKLKLSSFAVSFIILGLLTSTPEFAVGLQAVADHDPEIFVGNMLGGVAVIFLFVIPILAIFGNGINLKNDLDHKRLLATCGVILSPSLLILDKKVSAAEGIILIILYLLLILLIENKHGIFDKENKELLNMRAYSYGDIIKILFGIGIVFISSNIIVDKTMYIAQFFHMSAFYISLIAVSIGTNLPELSLAIRSVVTGKKDIAMGDYMGSAAANTLLFGVFTLLSGGEVFTLNSFFLTFIFILSGLAAFFLLSYKKNSISQIDGFVLLSIYILFIILEFIR